MSIDSVTNAAIDSAINLATGTTCDSATSTIVVSPAGFVTAGSITAGFVIKTDSQ